MSKKIGVLLLPIIMMLAFLPTVMAQGGDNYYVWDNSNNGHSIYAPLGQIGCEALSYADVTGLIRLKVELGIGFWMDCEAWGELSMTLPGCGFRVKPSITYEVEGTRLSGGIATISLKVIDKSTGQTIREMTDYLPHTGAGPETKTLQTEGFYSSDDRDYLYWVKTYVRVTGGVSGYGLIDYWTGDRRIKVQYLRINYLQGPGCPILSVYNGEEYVEEGPLDIHAREDVVVSHTLMVTPELEDHAYLLRLTEPDLPNSHSYIDQVKLLTVDKLGNTEELRLIGAVHSEYGNVLRQLLFSDDVRTNTLPYQKIDLRFLAPTWQSEFEEFIFVIEGYNIK